MFRNYFSYFVFCAGFFLLSSQLAAADLSISEADFNRDLYHLRRIVRTSADTDLLKDILNIPSVAKILSSQMYSLRLPEVKLDAPAIRTLMSKYEYGEAVTIVPRSHLSGIGRERLIPPGNLFQFAVKFFLESEQAGLFSHKSGNEIQVSIVLPILPRPLPELPAKLVPLLERIWRTILFEEFFHLLEGNLRELHHKFFDKDVTDWFERLNLPFNDDLNSEEWARWAADHQLHDRKAMASFLEELTGISYREFRGIGEVSFFTEFKRLFPDWFEEPGFLTLMIENHPEVRAADAPLWRAIFNREHLCESVLEHH